MKNRLTKIISSLLIMAFVVSFTSVFATAADEGTEEQQIINIFNRDFDDGWEATNGGAFTGGTVHNLGLGEEPTATGVNHYVDLTTGGNGTAGYYGITPSANGYSLATEFHLSFRVKSNGFATAGDINLLYGKVGGSDSGFYVLQKRDDGLYFYFNKKAQKIADDFTDWLDISVAFIADYKAETLSAQLSCKQTGFVSEWASISRPEKNLYPETFRFQVTAKSYTNKIGDNVCFDDITYVAGTSKPIELADDDYGALVNTSITKTVSQEGSKVEAGGKTDGDYINESFLMKTGVHRALFKGEKINIFSGDHSGEYGGPVVIDGITYLPIVPLLDYMGLNYSTAGNSSIDIAIASKDPVTGAVTTGVTTLYVGRDEARVAGEQVKLVGAPGVVKTGLYTTDEDGDEVEIAYTVIAMNDVSTLFPGWYVTYDSMGFIMVAGAPDLLSRESDLTTMATMLKKFVPDYPDKDQLLSDFSEATNNFDHPYLVADENELLFLRDVYQKKYLLEDGTPNEEFIEESGLSLDELETLQNVAQYWVLQGWTEYIRYIAPRDHETLTNVNGAFLKSLSTMYNDDGSFSYPYTQDMKGKGKVVFARPYTSKRVGSSVNIYDHVQDDYVIAESNEYFKAKKNYIYDEALGDYREVGIGNGIFDYVYDDFVILKTPLRNYLYNEETGSYDLVDAGTGTHDLVGTDADGKEVYAILRTPLKNYSYVSSDLSSNHYNIVFPSIDWSTYDTDPRSDTYLEFLSSVCYECGEDHFGYDPEGQRISSSFGAAAAVEMAIAYWFTGEISFARLAYDILDIFGNWEHWGPAHALNYAQASGEFALALDLIYDAVLEMSANGETNYKGEPMNVKVLEQHLWDHGIGEDYIMSVLNGKTAYLRDNVDKDGWLREVSSYYLDDTNNWGSVCNGNLAIAAIGLLSYTDIHTADKAYAKVYPQVPTGVSYRDMTLETLVLKMYCLPYYAADSYLENGAYTESPSYWAYGTNEMMYLQTVLYNTIGHDYGILDCPGYDKTFIYAAYMETELRDDVFMDYSYNDGSPAAIVTGFFFTAALQLNQPELTVIRLEHIRSGKTKSYADLFMFRKAVIASKGAEVKLELEYCEPAIGLYTTRSAWETEALFAGIMGGQGIYNHGHSDTGAWSYYNKGVMWIADMGSESYNVRSDTDYPKDNVSADWDSVTQSMKLHNRFRYYRLSTEGHNTLMLTAHPDTLPYGHRVSRNDSADLIQVGKNGEYFYSDEYGSYVIIDMNPMFVGGNGTEYTSSAKRGMLLTNSRQTLVIQDEISFTNMEFIAWCAHAQIMPPSPNLSHLNYLKDIKISEDKKSVILYSWSGDMVCRMSIVMEYEDSRFGFEIRKTDPLIGETEGVYLLDSTFAYNSELELGGGPQNSRSGWRNIVITPNRNGIPTTVRSVEMAVVLEVFEDETTAKNAPISYEFTPMAEWETYEEGTYSGTVTEGEVEMRKSATTADFVNVIIPNGSMLDVSLSLGINIYEISDIYGVLTNSAWSIKQLGGANTFTGINKTNAEIINDAIAIYENYCGQMNARMSTAAIIVDKLT